MYKRKETKSPSILPKKGKKGILMGNNEKEKLNPLINEESASTPSKHFSRAISSSLLRTYGILPITLLTTWLVARNISADTWGILIHAIIIVYGAAIPLSFFPPSIHMIILYKIPELKINKEYGKIKALIDYLLKFKFIVSSLVMIGYIGVCWLLSIYEANPIKLFCIMVFSPFIIINEVQSILISYFNSIKKFQISYQFIFVERVLLIVLYGFIFLLVKEPESIKVIYLVLANLLSFCPTTLIGLILYRSHTKTLEPSQIEMGMIKDYLKFGMLYSISLSIQNLQDQINYSILNLSPSESIKTYYNIARNFTGQAVGALNLPIGPILTELFQNNKQKEMVELFSKALSVSALILSLISGLLYYFLDVYILLIFPPEYAIITPIIRNSVFSIITLNIISNYSGLLLIMKRENDLIYLNLAFATIMSLFLFIGFNLHGLNGFIFAQIIASVIGVCMFWSYGFIIKKDISISILHLLKHYIFLILIIFLSNFITDVLFSMIDFGSLAILIQNIMSEYFQYDLLNQISILIHSGIKIATFLIVFLIIQFSFIKFNRDDLRSIINTGINFPFKNFIIKICK